jgi:hypothetical protein
VTLARVVQIVWLLGNAMNPAAFGQSPTTQNAPLEVENPALKRFSKAISFYASYDQSLTADVSSDKPDPRSVEGKVEFLPGLYGKSLLLVSDGHCGVVYHTEDVDLTKPGACAIWLSPHDWVRSDKEDYFWPVKIMGNNAQFMFGRMGQQLNPRTRDDATYMWAQVGQNAGVTIGGGSSLTWKNGEWHLWVMNWRGNSIEFSIDGEPLSSRSLPAQLDSTGKRGAGLIVAHHVPSDPYLLDELIVFNRPLTGEEVKWMYDVGMKQAGSLPAPTTQETRQ